MGRFYTDIRKYGNNILHRGYDENGKQFFMKSKFQPTFYIPTKNKNAKHKFFYGGVPMEPIQYETMQEAYENLQQFAGVNNFNVAGMEKFEYQYLVEQYPSEVPYDFDKIRVLNFDIEVDSSQGFPDPQLAQETVISITAECNGKYIVWGFEDYTPKDSNVTYEKCDSEYALLNKFIAFWKAWKPDVVTGWNTDTFDVPYMYNRITNVLGEDRAKLLSPWKVAKKRTVWIKNQPNEMIDLLGVEQLDYLNLYKVFTYKKRESYKLDHISHVELGEKKLSYKEMQNTSKLIMSGDTVTYDETKDLEELDEIQKWQKVRDKLLKERERRGL